MKTLIAALCGVLLSASTASAQANCAPRDAVLDRLAEDYGETRQSVGLGANNAVVEMFANIDSGSWTITVTMVNGLTCLVASGQAFEVVSEDLPPAGDPA